MKKDVLDALSGRFPKKIPSKETLDHPGIIKHVCGFDVYDDTPRAFDIAWRKLGIDIHVPLPTSNAPRPKVPNGTWEENGRRYSDYGVYPTSMPIEHLCPKENNYEMVWEYNPSTDDIDVEEEKNNRNKRVTSFNAHFGDWAVMYDLYYTTLFMWPIMRFGWEHFMLAAASDPVRFDEQLWQPWASISRKYFEAMASTEQEVIFCHDDLAMTSGPVFHPDFYEKYIFSRYEWIMEPAILANKKIVFVSDGNIDVFLERLLELPIHGIMYENPATPFERVLSTWGKAGRCFIGGISTKILTNGTPQEVATHTQEVMIKGREYPGFIISSCGQLPGNIPMENILAYFETRNKFGCPCDLSSG